MTLSEYLKQYPLIANVYDTGIDINFFKARFLGRYKNRKMREDLSVSEIQENAQNVIDINRDFLKNLFSSDLNPYSTTLEKSTTKETGGGNKTVTYNDTANETTDETNTYKGGGKITTTDGGTVKNNGKSENNNTNTGYVNAFNNSEPNAANKTTDNATASADNTETRDLTNTQNRDINDTTTRKNTIEKENGGKTNETSDNSSNTDFNREVFDMDGYIKALKYRTSAYDFLINLISVEILEIIDRG